MLLLPQGASPRVVRERLGHFTIAMASGLQSHVTLTVQDEAASKMEAMFGANGATQDIEDLGMRRADEN